MGNRVDPLRIGKAFVDQRFGRPMRRVADYTASCIRKHAQSKPTRHVSEARAANRLIRPVRHGHVSALGCSTLGLPRRGSVVLLLLVLFALRQLLLLVLCLIFFASSEKSVGHRYAPVGAGSSARAACEPDVG